MPSHVSQRNLRLLYAYWFLRDFQLWIPVWIVFLTLERGFSLTQVTFAEGLFLVAVIALEVPTGAVADRWGRSRSLGLGALFLGLAVLIFAFTTSYPILITSFLTWSLAQALMSGADAALLYDTLHASGEDGRYERFMGRGSAVNWGAAGLATLLGGPVAEVLDIRATILIGAATCVACAAVAFSLWEPPHQRKERPQRYLATIRAAFREAWHTTDVRRVILLFGTTQAAINAVHYVVQPYLVDRGLEVGVWFSMLQVPMIMAGALGALVSSRVQGRAGAIGMLLSVPLVAVGAYLTLAAAPGLWAYAALPLLFGLGSILLPVASGFVNRRISSDQRATVLSIQSMTTSLAMAVLAPLTGFVTDRWGLTATFTMGGLVALGAVVVFGAPLLAALRRPEIPLPAAADI